MDESGYYQFKPLTKRHSRFPERWMDWALTPFSRMGTWIAEYSKKGKPVNTCVLGMAYLLVLCTMTPFYFLILLLIKLDYRLTPHDVNDVVCAATVSARGLTVSVPRFKFNEHPTDSLGRAADAWNAAAGFDGIVTEGFVVAIVVDRAPARQGNYLAVDTRRPNHFAMG